MSLWLWFTAIGTAIWLSAASRLVNAFGTGYGVWVGVSSLIAIFIGAYLMSRLARISNRSTGMWNGVVLWALSFTLLLLFTSFGAGGMFGGFGRGVLPLTPSAMSILHGTVATSTWLFVIFQFLALVFAAFGGAMGARRSEQEDIQA
jgi:hypothetical protein